MILRRQSHNRYLALKTLGMGLGVAQLVATAQVHLSNLALHRQMTDAAAAGFVSVPNAVVIPELLEMGSAFWGGFFFTATVGCFLWLLAFSAAWIWDRWAKRSTIALALIVLVWLCGLTYVNLDGLNLFSSLYVACVPSMVFGGYALATRWRKPDRGIRGPVLHMAVMAVICLLWLPKVDSEFFVAVRDHFLLSNTPGRAVNDFYYRYTLYPARALKSLKQQQIRVVEKGKFQESPGGSGAMDLLRARDYLPLETVSDPVLHLKRTADELIWKQGGQTIFVSRLSDFMKDPDSELERLSAAVDRNAALRGMIFISLMVGTPIALYTVIFSLMAGIAASCGFQAAAPALGALAALLAFTAGFAFYTHSLGPEVTFDNFADHLKSPHANERLAGLEFMIQNRFAAGEYRDLLEPYFQGSIAERMHLARLLGGGRHKEDLALLLTMLSDPHPNVLCMTLQALGRRGGVDEIPAVMETLQASDHWYVQWYAYRALKSLGWIQTPSP